MKVQLVFGDVKLNVELIYMIVQNTVKLMVGEVDKREVVYGMVDVE